MRLFIEPSREERRLKLNRSKFADVLWYSNPEDYQCLRVLINFPVGLLLSYAVFQLGWKRLNFADFSDFYGSIFQWTVIFGSGISFSLSPVFRCAILCFIFEALGQSGQGLLSIFVVEQLNEGPVENILHNFELTSNMIICELELQGRVTAQRIFLASGPLEKLLEKNFDKTTSISQEVIRQLQSLLEPFESEMKDNTDEDKALVASLDAADVMAAREAIVNAENDKESNSSSSDSQNSSISSSSRWKEYKSNGARSVARRLLRRCQQIFAFAAKQCTERFADIQSKCYSTVPWILRSLICSQFNAIELCQASKMRKIAMEKCKLDEEDENGRNVLTPDLEDQWSNIRGITKELRDQMRINKDNPYLRPGLRLPEEIENKDNPAL